MSEPAGIDEGRQAILTTLEQHEVRYVVIGGAGAQTHGWQEMTDDLDLTPARDRHNLGRLAVALTELGARFRVDEQRYPDGFDPPGGLDARTFDGPMSLAFTTRHGDLDVAIIPDGTDGYDDLIRNATVRTVAQTTVAVSVAAFEDIERSKRAAGREKDLDQLPRMREDIEAARKVHGPKPAGPRNRVRGVDDDLGIDL